MLGKILGGRYQITHHLGGGGFGQTYLAEDLHLPGNPQCVVKQLKPRMTNPEAFQTARRLFDTEAEVLYTLGNHEQIPRLFAHFEENQDFFLVQEFVAGEVFSKELKHQKPFSEAEVILLLQDILTVLEFVHQQQVVHRDIKPSNLIRRKGDGRMILIDFGAVKQIGIEASDGPEASVTIAVGSSGYMPNEQLAGKPRFSSDIYAVGMVALQCLTGIYPRKLREDLRTSEILWRDQVQVSPELATILDTMVRYDYRQRYFSAKEALEALKSLTSTASAASLLSEQTLVSFDGHVAWLERGDELFQLQRYKEAISAYDRVIQAKSDDYTAWFKRGIALENLKNYEEAAASYEQVVQLQPDDYLAWYKQGSAYEQQRRYQEALQAYNRVVELQPSNYWAWHDRGKVLEQLHQDEEAISSYDRAVQLKPDFQLAKDNRKRLLSQLKQVDTLYHLQHYDEAVASCDLAIQQNPNDAIAWFMRGMALENLECYAQAIESYNRVVAIQPEDHVAWFKLGTLQEKLQRYENAVASYYKVVQIQPDNHWAWNDRARLLEKLSQNEAAIASYDRAVQLKPDLESAVEGRRRILRQLQSEIVAPSEEEDATVISGELSETLSDRDTLDQTTSDPELQDLKIAVDNYKRLIATQPLQASHNTQNETIASLSPSSEETIVHLADFEETAVSLPRLRESNTITVVNSQEAPNDPNSQEESQLDQYYQWLQQGRQLEKQQRYTDAIVAYDQALRIQANDPNLWYWRGNALFASASYQNAARAFCQALNLKPNDTHVLCCLGSSLVKLKRYKDALACFNRAIHIKPDNFTAWYHRGQVLYNLKHYSAALNAFSQAVELNPNFQPALSSFQQLQHQLKASQLEQNQPEKSQSEKSQLEALPSS